MKRSTLSVTPSQASTLRLQPAGLEQLQAEAARLDGDREGVVVVWCWWSVNVHSEVRSAARPRLAFTSRCNNDTDTCIHSFIHPFVHSSRMLLRCSKIPRTCHFQSACDRAACMLCYRLSLCSLSLLCPCLVLPPSPKSCESRVSR
jgi:hypothetical protein